jgi:hypothetical protein
MKLLIASALLVAFSANGQTVRIAGIGNVSCGEYLELRDRKSDAQDSVTVSWIYGYMGGFNMESKQPTTRDLPDKASALAFVDKHCRNSPLDNVLTATMALISELGGRRNPR